MLKAAERMAVTGIEVRKGKSIWSRIVYNKIFLFMLLPVIVFYIIFSYVPMFGLIIAFREFSYRNMFGTGWVGFENFIRIFSDAVFLKAIYNTIFISLGRLVFEFPVPILLALLLNEIRNTRHKRIFQTIYTFPHFVSWAVISAIIIKLFAGSGLVNQIITTGGHESIDFLTNGKNFLIMLFASNNIKEAGWSTIIYMATIAGINPEIYESAIVDGARRLDMVRFITWPSLKPVVMVMLILAVGGMMNAGFMQIYTMYNPSVYDVSDIVDTAIYRRTFKDGLDFSFSTAFGMFKSVVNMALLLTANYITKKVGENSII